MTILAITAAFYVAYLCYINIKDWGWLVGAVAAVICVKIIMLIAEGFLPPEERAKRERDRLSGLAYVAGKKRDEYIARAHEAYKEGNFESAELWFEDAKQESQRYEAYNVRWERAEQDYKNSASPIEAPEQIKDNHVAEMPVSAPSSSAAASNTPPPLSKTTEHSPATATVTVSKSEPSRLKSPELIKEAEKKRMDEIISRAREESAGEEMKRRELAYRNTPTYKTGDLFRAIRSVDSLVNPAVIKKDSLLRLIQRNGELLIMEYRDPVSENIYMVRVRISDVKFAPKPLPQK